jgi:hypothetical protein
MAANDSEPNGGETMSEDEASYTIATVYHNMVEETEGVIARLKKRRQDREAAAFEKRLEEIRLLEQGVKENSEESYSDKSNNDDFIDYW